jgi:hypothetical protein
MEIELPSFSYPVYFDEPDYNFVEVKSELKVSKNNEDSFDDIILFSDPDYDKKLPDPLEELFFYFVRQTESNNPQEVLPNKE